MPGTEATKPPSVKVLEVSAGAGGPGAPLNALTTFGQVVANAGWNFIGNVLPLVAAVVAIPYLIGQIGTDRFGLLSIAWVLIGYFSLFDLGLGRALTKMVAERVDAGEASELSSLCSTGLAMVLVLGGAASVLLVAALPWSDLWLQKVPSSLHGEARNAVLLIAVGVPTATVTAALRGVLEGFQRFRLLTAIRIPAGTALFLAPCATALFTPRLDWSVASVLATRFLVLAAHAIPSMRAVSLRFTGIRRSWVTPMLRFGGWLTVSNVVSPVIVNVDRFVIGGLISATALAYYSVPFEIVSRVLLVPISLTGALFPALAQSLDRDRTHAQVLRRRATRLTMFLVLPLCVIGAIAAHSALRFWLGVEFAEHSYRVMQLLLIGLAFNSLAQVPFASLQSYGWTRAIALLHLVELPLHLLVLMTLVRTAGLEGAALAWTVRATLDYVGLMWILGWLERKGKAERDPLADADPGQLRGQGRV